MWICYLISTIPLIIGLVLWLTSKKITIAEWALSFGIGIIITLIIHAISISGMTTDTETWSGQIDQARYSPAWVEEYKVAIYKNVTKTRTVGTGKNRHTETYTERVFSHYETRYRDHPNEWDATDTLGQTFSINPQTYAEIKNNFGKEISKTGLKSGYHSGAKETYLGMGLVQRIWKENHNNRKTLLKREHMTKRKRKRLKGGKETWHCEHCNTIIKNRSKAWSRSGHHWCSQCCMNQDMPGSKQPPITPKMRKTKKIDIWDHPIGRGRPHGCGPL